MLKPSAARSVNQVSSVSAMVVGYPHSTQCPRAAEFRL